MGRDFFCDQMFCTSDIWVDRPGLGAWPPRKFLEFRGYEVASETIFGPKRCFSEARRQSFTCMSIYPFCLASFPGPASFPSLITRLFRTASDGKLGGAWERGYFLPVAPYSTAWFRLSDRSLISQATPFADRSVIDERKIVGRLGLSHCSQPSRIMLQHVTTLCTCHGRLPSIGPIWRHQASHGWRKKWSGFSPVETGLTGPVATALLCKESCQRCWSLPSQVFICSVGEFCHSDVIYFTHALDIHRHRQCVRARPYAEK